MGALQHTRGRLVSVGRDQSDVGDVCILMVRDKEGQLRPLELWVGKTYSIDVKERDPLPEGGGDE